MERIQRALEIARAGRASALAEPPRSAGRPDVVVPIDPAGSRSAPPAGALPAELPRLRLDRDGLESRHVVLPGESGAPSHAYRMLRTQILTHIRARACRVIGIVSATDNDGKTLTATNLALSLCTEPNQTVILVDLDLRRPSIAPLLGIQAERGLEQWLAGRASLDDVCVGVEGLERLLVLPTMHAVPNSADLLAGPRLAAMLGELRGTQSDRVVIVDLPPALLATDVLTVAPLLDGVVVVAAEGRTRRDDLQRLRELLLPVRVIGTVLNMASDFESRAY